MNDPLTVTLPWMDKALSPNSRNQWAKIKAAKDARAWGYMAVRQNYLQGDQPNFPDDARLQISFIFHPPDHKYRDLDNMVAMCKAYADGIFEAIQNNDKQIDTIEARKKDVVKGGSVTISISEDE